MKVEIGTYEDKDHGFTGWVSHKEEGWIIFVRTDGQIVYMSSEDLHKKLDVAPKNSE